MEKTYVTKDGIKKIIKAMDKTWKPTDKESASNKATILSILDKEYKKAEPAINASEPPNIMVASKFAAEKWDDDYARNALLHYVVAKGLEKDCELWMDAHFPDHRDDED